MEGDLGLEQVGQRGGLVDPEGGLGGARDEGCQGAGVLFRVVGDVTLSFPFSMGWLLFSAFPTGGTGTP